MEPSNSYISLKKQIIKILVLTIITAAAIAGFLLYKGDFNKITYSDWLFYMAIIYTLLSIIPVYTVLSSSNDLSYRYGEHMIRGKIDISSRIKDIAHANDFRFTIVMFVSAVFLMALSAITNNVL